MSLFLTAGLMLLGALALSGATASAQDTMETIPGPTTTVLGSTTEVPGPTTEVFGEIPNDPPPGIIPLPNSGGDPVEEGDRGSFAQYAVLVATVVGLIAIALLIARESRRNKGNRTPPPA